jgi:carboxyl-terminal processing protease
MTLNRVVVSEPPVAETMYEDSSILYLKPMDIDREHVQQVESKLKAMKKAGNKKILLDLRDVADGDMNEAVHLANFFISSGTIATLEGQKYPKETFTSDPANTINATAPLVVLINRGTSGPAELVAAAIQDDKRGQLVGEKPSGKQFEDDAVTPGTLVAATSDAFDMDSEDGSSEAETEPKTAAPRPDDQLTKALDILKAKAA